MIITSVVTRLVPEYRAAMAEINALVERTLDPAVPDCDAPSTAEINDARLRLHVAALSLAQAVSDQVALAQAASDQLALAQAAVSDQLAE